MTELQQTNDAQSFDPRFPLAYQPGYDPDVHGRHSVLRRTDRDPVTSRRDAPQDRPEDAPPADAHHDGTRDTHSASADPSTNDFLNLFGPTESARPTSAAKRDVPVATLMVNGVPSVDEPATTASAASQESVARWWQRVNPWASGLFVAGALIVVLAIWWGYYVASEPANRYSSPNSELNVYLFQWAMIGVPVVVAAGLVIMALGATALAVRWRR